MLWISKISNKVRLIVPHLIFGAGVINSVRSNLNESVFTLVHDLQFGYDTAIIDSYEIGRSLAQI